MNKIKQKWQKYVVMLMLMMLFMSFSTTANAESPFDTFSVNGFGKTIFTQPAYEPKDVLAQDIYIEDEDGENVYSPLSQPKDFVVDDNDDIYIADTGNNRIVHLDEDGELINIFEVPDSPLNQPSGIFITEDGIYVADTGNRRVVLLSHDGEMVQEFARPESKYIDDDFVYEPTNMVVDRRGFVYVVSRGTFQGIIQFNPEAEFYGFYGTNITEVSFMDRIRNIFYTKEQLSRQVRLLPNPISNIAIDDDGYIYTVSKDSAEQIKKLNIRGENQWADFQYEEHINLRFLRRDTFDEDDDSSGGGTQLTDVIVDDNGIVTVTDNSSSIIAQFNQNGEVLFFWGAPNTSGAPQKGALRSPVALGTNSKKQILVLDDTLNFIQVLSPTEFGETVQTAFVYTDQGEYEESEKYWAEVVRQNALFTPAYMGLARAAFYKENYNEALDLYKRAGDEDGYSDSFWQLRLDWFQSKFSYVASGVLILGVLSVIWFQIKERIRKKRRKEGREKKKKRQEKRDSSSVWGQLKHAFYILRHPIDGFDDIRFNNKGGYISAIIILILVVTIALARIFFTSFTFHPVQEGMINVTSLLTISAAFWVSWVICHYLIGAIRHGQARFKDIFVGSAYALFPIFILGIPLAALSNIMTLSEISIYNAIYALMVFWCAALYFWMIMTLQNYSVGETIVSILLTLFSMIILWVLIFIIFGLASETIDFIVTLYREVTM